MLPVRESWDLRGILCVTVPVLEGLGNARNRRLFGSIITYPTLAKGCSRFPEQSAPVLDQPINEPTDGPIDALRCWCGEKTTSARPVQSQAVIIDANAEIGSGEVLRERQLFNSVIETNIQSQNPHHRPATLLGIWSRVRSARRCSSSNSPPSAGTSG